MKLLPLLSGYPVLRALGDIPVQIAGFTSNSKQVKPGYMYICIRGETQDGHCYAEEAAKNGACVIVSERPLAVTVPVICVAGTRHFLSFFADRYYGRPSRRLHITGITGTNGKTTSAHFLYQIHIAAGIKSALMGTIGIKSGERYYKQTLTTPGAEELHKIFWQLVRNGVSHVTMEVSSHALVQKRVEHCRFQAAVFTNLTREHLDYHQSMENYFEAKSRLFTLSHNKPDFKAIINADDKRGKILAEIAKGKVFLYGVDQQADINIREILTLTGGGSYVRLDTPLGTLSFIVYLPGRYNVYNAVAAATAAFSQGIPLRDIATGIEALREIPGRLEQLPSPRGVRVYLDYAHTPDGLEKVLEALSKTPHRNIYLVFGCRGNRDRGKRPLMGGIAEQYANYVIITADNPATEDPYNIANEIARDMRMRPVIIPDREHAIHYALSLAEIGDIVLITGKGRENYQIIGENSLPYSDIQAVANYFTSKEHH
jgi:UDP-N-acetylmuramoyl-L-alanyl-D-glutamate--2,6-diaminopimelate ligase